MRKFLLFSIAAFLIFETGLQIGKSQGRRDERKENAELITALLEENARLAIDSKILHVLECESGFRHDVYGDSGRSYGIAQIQYPTFRRLRRASGMTRLRYSNPVHQVRLLRWSIANGYGGEWSCYKGGL